MKEALLVFLGVLRAGIPVEMVALRDGACGWVALVHVGHVLLHLRSGEHGCVGYAEGLEDVRLEVVV